MKRKCGGTWVHWHGMVSVEKLRTVEMLRIIIVKTKPLLKCRPIRWRGGTGGWPWWLSVYRRETEDECRRFRRWTLGIDATSLRPTECWRAPALGRRSCWILPMSCSWRANEDLASSVGSGSLACCTELRQDRLHVLRLFPLRKNQQQKNIKTEIKYPSKTTK